MEIDIILLNYIDNFNFDEYIKSLQCELVEEKYKLFTDEFWKNPNVSLLNLKSKHDIHNSVSFSNILKQHPSDKYIRLIEDCWNHAIDKNDLVRKHGIKLMKLEQLLFPIPYSDENYMCPKCLDSNEFIIKNNIKYSKYTITCSKCKSYINNLISTKEVQQRKQFLINKISEFEIYIHNIEDNLEKIKCPKCQSNLILNSNSQTLEYLIKCTKCNVNYDNYDLLLTDYESWRQRAAMMIKIRAKEEDLIKELLVNKDFDDIKLKMEDLIKGEDSIDTIEYFADRAKTLDDNEFFIELFKKVKSCSRLGKMLLINICELIDQSNNDLSTWTYSNSSDIATQTRFIESDDPIIVLLQSITKILPIRKVMKELIQQKLVYCDEEENKLHVHPLLIDNLSSIKNLLKPQNISNELAWLIFSKQKFTCYHCGENGRPLKIAYLSTQKDNNVISNMAGICDQCFYDVTEDEILIDAMISGTEEYDNESPVSWRFLVYYYSHLENDDEAYGINLSLLDQYNEVDIIKSYAATIDKFSRENNKGNFFAYAEAILKNSEKGVYINGKIEKNYKVKEWLSKLD